MPLDDRLPQEPPPTRGDPDAVDPTQPSGPGGPLRNVSIPVARAASGVTDRDLVRSVLETGEEAAFRELYRRHTPRLFQFVLRFIGGGEMDAEDVVQEVWVNATRRLKDFRWESRFETWLTAIGINLSRDHLRRRKRRGEPETLEGDIPVAVALHAERIDLETAIAALPDGYRTVLLLHDVEGLKHHEIATALGISTGTSKSQLFGARQAVRRLLGSAKEGNHAVYRQ